MILTAIPFLLSRRRVFSTDEEILNNINALRLIYHKFEERSSRYDQKLDDKFDLTCLPPWDRIADCLSSFHITGTARVQFGYSYAETAGKERSELYRDFWQY